jgi:transcription antitermination factor NusG
MRDLIQNKFQGIKHKWFYLPTTSKDFQYVVDLLTQKINQGNITVKESIEIVKAFKKTGKMWLKLITVKGRSNLYCECLLITTNNTKIKTALSCESILASELMMSTPKSLKLFDVIKDKNEWKKADSFIDPITYPPVEEELTECGYFLYKAFLKEKQKNKEFYSSKLYTDYWSR